jgi:hypothetical protein
VSSVIYQKRVFSNLETILWAILTAVYIANGVGFVIKTYWSDFKHFTWDITKRPKTQNMFVRFLFFYILSVPFVTHAGVVGLAIIDMGSKAQLD